MLAPLHVALGWILTRDIDFATYLYDHDVADVEAELKSFDLRSGRQTSRAVRGLEETWQLLLKEAQVDHIRLRGVPFEKSPHLNAIVDHGVDKIVIRPDLPPRRIREEKLPQLTLLCPAPEFAEGGLQLRPQTWLANGGWWWEWVFTDWGKILELFPATSIETTVADAIERPSSPSEDRSPNKGNTLTQRGSNVELPPGEHASLIANLQSALRKSHIPPMHRMIITAYINLFKPDFPEPTPQIRDAEIGNWIKHRYGPSILPKSLTIRRALYPK
jgi:hypothetical protein